MAKKSDDMQQLGLDASGTFSTIDELSRYFARLEGDARRMAESIAASGDKMGHVNVVMSDVLDGIAKLTVSVKTAEDGTLEFTRSLNANAVANRRAAEAQRLANTEAAVVALIAKSNTAELKILQDVTQKVILSQSTPSKLAVIAQDEIALALKRRRLEAIELLKAEELLAAQKLDAGKVGSLKERSSGWVTGRGSGQIVTQRARSEFGEQEDQGKLAAEKNRIAAEDINRQKKLAEQQLNLWTQEALSEAAIRSAIEKRQLEEAKQAEIAAEEQRLARVKAISDQILHQGQVQADRETLWAKVTEQKDKEIAEAAVREEKEKQERIEAIQRQIYEDSKFQSELILQDQRNAAQRTRDIQQENADAEKRFQQEIRRAIDEEDEHERELRERAAIQKQQQAAADALRAQKGAEMRARIDEHAIRLAGQAEERAQAQRAAEARQSGSVFTGRAMTGRAGSVAEVQQIRGIIKGITDEIEKGTVAAGRAHTIFNNVQAGIRQNLSGVEAKIAETSRRAIGAAQSMGRAFGDDANQMIQQNRALGREFEKMGNQGQGAFNRLEISWASVVRLVFAQTVHTAVRQIFQELHQGMDTAAQFQLRISEIRTISQTSQLSFNQWASAVRALSDEFGNPILETAEGLYETISNQVAHGAESTQFMVKAMEFARVGVASTADSVNLLSSALNAYHLSTSEVDRVSAILFKTVDLGRVRVSELANSFGRVASLSAPLGVTLEEVATAIATLTIQGIKYNEAYTLINNVLTKLIRPTKEMKEEISSWGYSSGQAAIAGLTFEGVLNKLQATANKGVGEISELFNEIRGQRGALALTGAFDTFQRDLAQITNSMGQYREAQKIAAESAGREWLVELNKIKNYFETLGTDVLHTMVEWTRGVDSAGKVNRGFSDTIKDMVAVVTSLVEAYAAYRAVLILTGAAQRIANVQNAITVAQMGLEEAGIANVTRAEVRRDILRRRFNPNISFRGFENTAESLSALALPVSLMAGAFLFFGAKASEASEKAAKMYDEIETVAQRAADEQTKILQERLDKETQAHRNALDAQTRIYLQREAVARASADRIVKFQVDLAKFADKQLKDIFDVSIKVQNDRLEELNRQMTAAQNVIKQGEELIFRMKQDLQHGKFDREVGLLPGPDRVKAIQDQIKRLQDDAQRLLTAPVTGGVQLEDNFKKAQEELKEVNRLQNEMQQTRQNEAQKEEQLRQRLVELEGKHNDRVKQRGANEDVADARGAIARAQHHRGGAKLAGLRNQLGAAKDEAQDVRTAAQDRQDDEEIAQLKKKLEAQDAIKKALGDQNDYAKSIEQQTARTIKLIEDMEIRRAKALEDRYKKEQELQRLHLEGMKTAFQDIAKFKLPTKPDGSLDIELPDLETAKKAGKTRDQVVSDLIKEQLKPFDEKVKELQGQGVTDPKIYYEIAQQRARYENEATAAIWKAESDARASEYAKRKQQLVELREEVKKEQIQTAQSIETNAAAAAEGAKTLQQFAQSTGRAQLFEWIGNKVGIEGRNPQVTAAVEKFAASVEELKRNPQGVGASPGTYTDKLGRSQALPGVSNVEAAREALRQMILQVTIASGTTGSALAIPGSGDLEYRGASAARVKDLGLGKGVSVADMQEQLQNYLTAITKSVDAVKNAGLKQQQLDVATKKFEDWSKAVGIGQTTVVSFTDRVKGETDALNDLIAQTNRATTQLAAMEKVIQGVQGAGTWLQNFAQAHPIPTKWQGGMIYRQEGGYASRGSDIIHAMLSPGEFVVNAAATLRNKGLLEAINAGIEPIIMPKGQAQVANSEMTMNTYHINVPVTIQGVNPAYDAQAVGKAIGRELSKGTITFDRSKRG